MRWPIADLPLRSLLFVPGNNPRMIQKSWTTGADGLIFDLEDAVPEGAKAEARENVRIALETTRGGRPCPFVRINSSRAPDWRADVAAMVGKNLRGIVIPKCESPGEVASLDKIVRKREKALRLPGGSISFLLLIESARGLLQAARLAESSDRIAALVFGAEDFRADMGMVESVGGNELLYARSRVAVCARASRCLAIDTIHADFNDVEGLLRETGTCRRLGFSGKLAIHPKQVAPIHSAFAPSDEELSEARTVLKVFAEAQAKGLGVVALRGRMIDRPVVERARQVIALAKSHDRG